MTPNLVQESSAASQEEVQLVQEAAHRINPPPECLEAATETALGRLLQEKERRLGQGLTHWETQAQEVAERLLREVLEEDKRQKELTEFFLATREDALAFAKAFLDREEDAEDAVSEAFDKLSAGKTSPPHFFRTLKHLCVDKYRRIESAGQVIKPAPAPRLLGGTWPDSFRLAFDPPATEGDGQDPLEVLIRRESIRDGIQEVLTRSEHRWIRQLKWWGELLDYAVEQGILERPPAQLNDPMPDNRVPNT